MGTTTKRMSAEEKRKTVLGIYHKGKSVYIEKEIITLATKAGVNSNTIADINQSLIDDGFVDKEKINGSNYFWSFPAKKDFLMQIQHQQMLESNQQLKLQADDAEAKLNDAKRGREETGDRAAKLQRLNEMAAETKVLEEELEALKENDPQALADLEHELKLVTQAAHRWTDNLFNCKSYLVTKRGMDKKEANKIIGIPASFDYPEDKIPK